MDPSLEVLEVQEVLEVLKVFAGFRLGHREVAAAEVDSDLEVEE